jgi:cellobiose PTS system EIIC component
MHGFLDGLKRGLAAAGERTGRSIYLLSVRDGIVAVLPLVLIGSFFYLLIEPPLVRDTWQHAYAASMAQWIPRFLLVFKATTGMVALYAAFAIAYHLARRRDVDPLAAGLIAVTADLAVVAPLRAPIGPDAAMTWVLPLENVGPAGLFAAILIAIYVVELQRFVIKRNWVVRLPDSVPEAVYRSFLSLVPAALGISSLWFLVHGVGFDLFGTVARLSKPLLTMTNSLPGILTVVLIDSVIWLFGIHAVTILAVMKPLWLQMITANMEAAQQGMPIPHIAPREFYIWFVWMGGSGTSLALVAHLLTRRSKQLRSVAKLGLVPAVFNINDPIMFGVPVVMNPMLAVPFIVAPLVCAVNAFVAFHFEWVARPAQDTLWTLPAPIGAFLATKDPRSLVLLALNFGLAYLIYAPFVRAYDNRLMRLEAAGTAHVPAPAVAGAADVPNAVAEASRPEVPAAAAQRAATPAPAPAKTR